MNVCTDLKNNDVGSAFACFFLVFVFVCVCVCVCVCVRACVRAVCTNYD